MNKYIWAVGVDGLRHICEPHLTHSACEAKIRVDKKDKRLYTQPNGEIRFCCGHCDAIMDDYEDSIIKQTLHTLADSQEDLEPEFRKILNDNFMKLLEN